MVDYPLAYVLYRRVDVDPAVDLPAAENVVGVAELAAEDVRQYGHHHQGEDDEREHGEREAGADLVAERIGDGGNQHGAQYPGASCCRRERAQEQVGVVHDRPDRGGDHEHPGDEHHLEVGRQLRDQVRPRVRGHDPEGQHQEAQERKGQPVHDVLPRLDAAPEERDQHRGARRGQTDRDGDRARTRRAE